MTRMPARIHRMFELIHKSIRSYEFSASGMQSARWPASGAQPPVRSGHRAISSCAAVERSGDVDRLLAFTASSRTSFQQGSPGEPSVYTFRYRLPYIPSQPAAAHLSPAPDTALRCTQDPVYTAWLAKIAVHRNAPTQNPLYTESCVHGRPKSQHGRMGAKGPKAPCTQDPVYRVWQK